MDILAFKKCLFKKIYNLLTFRASFRTMLSALFALYSAILSSISLVFVSSTKLNTTAKHNILSTLIISPQKTIFNLGRKPSIYYLATFIHLGIDGNNIPPHPCNKIKHILMENTKGHDDHHLVLLVHWYLTHPIDNWNTQLMSSRSSK